MPRYEIELKELGTMTRTFQVIADNKDDASEQIWDEGLELESEDFESREEVTFVVRELADCDCDICERRGPWSCVTEDNML